MIFETIFLSLKGVDPNAVVVGGTVAGFVAASATSAGLLGTISLRLLGTVSTGLCKYGIYMSFMHGTALPFFL
jgi:hypothetical protein